MKLTFIGAGGARTPLVIQSILAAQDRLPLRQVWLMDNDAGRLDLMRMASASRIEARKPSFELAWTTDAARAIEGADFIVTTFRVGLMASRVIDEQVPLGYGVLGQETTGPGGFAMALRTIPVLLGYIEQIRRRSPQAWLLNFTNPAGILTEAATRVAGFERTVGICDNPAAMVRAAAAFLGVEPQRLLPEYYGLNHLGWLRALYLDGVDQVPGMLQALRAAGGRVPGLPFESGFLDALRAIPNEYLLFYYEPRRTVDNLLRAGQSRAQQIEPFNDELYASLRRIRDEEADPVQVEAAYAHYLRRRHATYMSIETGEAAHAAQAEAEPDPLAAGAEGYSGVALGLIEALACDRPCPQVLNVPNRGAVPGMAEDDVVEVTCYVGQGMVRPLALGAVPDHALGLMKSVKAYERLTIQAAVEGSRARALEALALHPLVPSYEIACRILDDYIVQHGEHFPRLA